MNTTWKTHEVNNQFDELMDYNLFTTDTVMNAYLKQNKLEEYLPALQQTGQAFKRYDC